MTIGELVESGRCEVIWQVIQAKQSSMDKVENKHGTFEEDKSLKKKE